MSEVALRGGELQAGPPPLPPPHPRPSAQPAAPAAAEQPAGQPPVAAWGAQAGHAAAAAIAAQQQPARGSGVPASASPAVDGQPPGGHEAAATWQQALGALPHGGPGFAVPVMAAPELQQAALLALGAHPAAATPVPAAATAAPGGDAHHPPGLHHLTRHWLPEEARGEAVLHRMGAPDMRTAEHMIR